MSRQKRPVTTVTVVISLVGAAIVGGVALYPPGGRVRSVVEPAPGARAESARISTPIPAGMRQMTLPQDEGLTAPGGTAELAIQAQGVVLVGAADQPGRPGSALIAVTAESPDPHVVTEEGCSAWGAQVTRSRAGQTLPFRWARVVSSPRGPRCELKLGDERGGLTQVYWQDGPAAFRLTAMGRDPLLDLAIRDVVEGTRITSP
ncbi:MAG: hypothetical protein AB2A00_12605 [Myxococcota bacterium]